MIQKLLFLICISLVICQPQPSVWDDIDYEIFDLNDALVKLKGPGVTFYDALEVDPNADLKTISSSYRKTSLKYHPDKNPGEDSEKMSKIITSIGKILKDSQSKSKYDDHLNKGFPVWRGSGYYCKNIC